MPSFSTAVALISTSSSSRHPLSLKPVKTAPKPKSVLTGTSTGHRLEQTFELKSSNRLQTLLSCQVSSTHFANNRAFDEYGVGVSFLWTTRSQSEAQWNGTTWKNVMGWEQQILFFPQAPLTSQGVLHHKPMPTSALKQKSLKCSIAA